MCGRYAFYSSKVKIKKQYDAQIPLEFKPRYNIGPGQKIIALISSKDSNAPIATELEWGLSPKWGGSKSKLIINARCETVHEKNIFKKSFRERRCIILADGWYEWAQKDSQKRPYYFHRHDNRLLAFAGVMSSKQEDGSQRGLVLTREASTQISHIHSRMPLLLTREQVNNWLSPTPFAYISKRAVGEFDTSIINYYPVSTKVNAVKNDDEYLINKISYNFT